MDKVTKHYDKDGKYVGLSYEHGEPENRRDEEYKKTVHSSGGSSALYIGTVIIVIVGIILLILFVRAFILGGDGDWSTMMTMLKIAWFIIRLPFVIVWFLIKIPFIIADKITVPGLLLIALVAIIAAIIFGNRKKKG